MKKRRVLALIAMLCMLVAAICGVAACDSDEHTHSYGEWTITQEPTLESGGKATHKCTEDDYSEEVDIPALSDALWTKSVKTPATHASGGVDTYTSAYGSVDVDSAKLTEHTWGAWSITQDPTLTAGGKAKHTCTLNDGGEEEIDIPALNDASVWTKDEEASTPATHTATGTDVYTSVYGSVNVTTDKLAEHSYGAWTITQDPTLTTGGKAKHTCTLGDNHEEEIDIPALNDAEVWTKDEQASTPATHTAPGTDVYKSEYGTVEVEIPAKSDEHQWSAWSWKDGTEPTEETGATATRSCEIAECNETEEKTVPNLKDASVWECDETPATYNGKGSKVYTSEYGTVTVETAKLVAPYDGKTYHQIDIKVQENRFNGTLSVGNNWQDASLTLDENGVGLGKAYPFSNNTKIAFTMVDPETGKISISFTSKAAEDAEDAFTGEVKTVTGYVDMATGFVLMAYNGEDFTECYLLTPYGQYSNGATASVWGESALNYGIALSYTYTDTTEKTETLYISNSGVHFGVTFTDLAGEAVKAENCYNAAQLYIKKGETVLASLGYNGETMVALDGYEGEYEDATLGKVTLSGVGTLTASKDDVQSTGTYTIAGENTLDLLVTTEGATKSYTATVDRSVKSMTATEVKVTVSFNMNDHGTQEAQEGYKNVEMELPTPTDEAGEYLFRGWFLEEGCTTPVPDPFKPSENVTLYAKWVEKLTVKVHALPDQSTSEELEVGVGDNILESLQKFDTSVKDGKVFKDWYTLSGEDKVYLSSYPESVYSAENDSMDLYSEWESAPYVGDYNGANLYSATTGSSTSGSYHINIAADGKVTGKYSGTVVDYSKENQLITVQGSGSTYYYFYFDEATGLLATTGYSSANNTYIGNDMALYSRTLTSFTHRAINVPNPSTGSGQNFYARFVEMQVTVENDGADPTQKTILVLIYGTHIYSDITVTDAFGTPITQVADIATSKTIIVTDNSSSVAVRIFAKGSEGDNLGSGNTADLDEYFGTYTKADSGELKLDGAGTLLWGDKKGTYKAAPEGSSYTFDAYITEGETQVYYELTVDSDEKNYTLEKIEVSVTLDKGEVGEDETNSYNKNIEFTLEPLVDDEGTYLFRGWFSDPDFVQELEKDGGNYVFAPTEATTLYAKWVKKVTITVHLGEGETLPEGSLGADGTIDTFGQGEEVTLARPAKSGSKFGGWFTDVSRENPWGEMGEDGSTTVTLEVGDVVAIDLYPKWEGAPAYSGEYKLYYLDDSRTDGGVDKPGTYNTNVVIDAEGFLAKTSGTAWPFTSYDLHVSGLESGDGEFVFLYSNGDFDAAYDSASGLITMIARGSDYGDMFLFVPVSLADAAVTNSYWKSGEIRAITVAQGDVKHNIFLSGNKAYFGVTFEDKDGTAVAAEEAYHTENRFYVKKDGAAIEGVKGYGYNGTTMVELDGYEGEYTYAGEPGDELNFGKIEVSGTGSLTTEKPESKKGTYTLVSGQSYTAELRLEGLFYYLTLTLNPENNTYTVVKPMATITYVLVDATDGTSITSSNGFVLSGSENFNTEFEITEVPEVEGYVFRGWYTTNDDWSDRDKLSVNGSGNYVYTPTEMSVTLYARFLKEVTLTLHYGNEMQDVVITLGAGESVSEIKPSPMPADPTVVNQKRFLGWYQDEQCSDGNKWDTSYVVNVSKTIYAKWSEPLGDVNYTPDESEEATKWVQEDGGSWKSNNYHKGGTTAKLEILFTVEGTYSFHWFAQSEGTNWDYLKIVHKHADGSADTTLLNNAGGKDGMQGDLNVEVMPGDTLVLTYQKDSSGDTDEDCGRISNIVWTKTVYDEFKGDYEGSMGDVGSAQLQLNGKGGAVWNGRPGTYNVKVDAENTIEVYLKAGDPYVAEYWVVTLNKDELTYVAEKPMVTVNFEIDDETLTAEAAEYNVNIPVALPDVATESKYVEGWYTDALRETPVTLDENGLYVPKGSEAVTLYGKSAEKLSVTLHYNGHGETPDGTKVLHFKKGETPDLSGEAPEDNSEPKNYFTGWYNEVDCTTVYEPAPLERNIDIYAGWTTDPFNVEFVNLEYNKGDWEEIGGGVYQITAQSSQNKAVIKITFKQAGKFTFDWEMLSNTTGNYLAYDVNPSNPTLVWYSGLFSQSKTGSGSTSEISVRAGDVLYIGYYVFESNVPGDYAKVSNFNFVAG